MNKKRLLVLSVLMPSMLFSFIAIKGNKAEVVKADGPVLAYKLDFADETDRGANKAGTASAAAHFYDNGGISFTNDAPNNGVALHLNGSGVRKNFFEIPGDALEGQSTVSIAGWYKIDYNCPDFSRMIEVSKHISPTLDMIDVDRIDIMPKAPDSYGGHKFAVLENVETKGGGGWHDSPNFHGPSGSHPGNTPADTNQLVPYEAWTHLTYVFGPNGIKVYQNPVESNSYV